VSNRPSSLLVSPAHLPEGGIAAYSNNFNVLLFWINAINDPIAFYFIASQALKLFLKGFAAVWIFKDATQAKSYVGFDYGMEFS
jgi:hypothetical protein